jgi:tripartite ATP-independent transporter DctM subunit
MSIEIIMLLLIIGMVTVFAMGMPVGFGIGAVTFIIAGLVWGPQAFLMIPSTAISVISSFILLAAPLFIFMGTILEHSGLGDAMFRSVHLLTGRLRGGLAIGVIAVCSLMAAMVGIIGAGVVTAGTIALPPMLKRGYNKYLALGSVMAGGGLGILIPPSLTMVLFASLTNTSIGKMFAGGMIPGLMMAGSFMVYIAVRCWINPEMGPPLPPEECAISFRQKIAGLRDGLIAFSLVVLALGSILVGAATPTEAAAITAIGAMLVALFYGRLTLDVMKKATSSTMKLTGMIIWILIGAQLYSNFQMLMGAHKLLNQLVVQYDVAPVVVIIIMQIIMLIMGCFMDEFIVVMICAPLFTPIALSLGYDPIWFGVLMILNMEVAIQSPPYGFCLFYLKAVAPPEITMLDIYKSVAPFVAIKIGMIVLVIMFPGIITWLPNLIFKY